MWGQTEEACEAMTRGLRGCGAGMGRMQWCLGGSG